VELSKIVNKFINLTQYGKWIEFLKKAIEAAYRQKSGKSRDERSRNVRTHIPASQCPVITYAAKAT
jgi:hypothetical protein